MTQICPQEEARARKDLAIWQMPASHNGTCMHLADYMEHGKQILVWPRMSVKNASCSDR